MGASHTIDQRGGAEPRRLPTLVVALGLDALAILLFTGAFTHLVSRDPQDPPNETFFSDPLPAVLLLTAASVAIAAGVVAGVSLWRTRLRTRAGRWATRLALANTLFLPVLGVAGITGAWLVGYDLPDGWGQPFVPLWMATGVAAAILGVVAKEPGRRGILVIPSMIGAFVLIFWLGEILVPH
jgi:multisubunit Na+/H+ antiporter MnhC subunit